MRRGAAGIAAAGLIALGAVVGSQVITGTYDPDAPPPEAMQHFYVAPNGTATTGCTFAAPCGRIANALEQVTDPDTQNVYLKAGTYGQSTGCFTYTADCVRDASNNPTSGQFKAKKACASPGCNIDYPYEAVAMNGAANTRYAAFTDEQEVQVRPAPGAEVIFERDLEFTVQNVLLDGLDPYESSNISINNARIEIKNGSNDTDLTNLNFTGSRQVRYITQGATHRNELSFISADGNVNGSSYSVAGTIASGQGSGLWIHDNRFGENTCTDCVLFHTDTFHIWNWDGAIVERNWMPGSTSTSVYIEGNPPSVPGGPTLPTENILMQNNYIAVCPVGVMVDCNAQSTAIKALPNTSTFDNIDIYNNTVIGYSLFANTSGEAQGNILYPSPGLDVRGNIFTELYDVSGTVQQCERSDWNTTWAQQNVIGATTCSKLEVNNVIGDPLFTDPDNDDYTLQAGSPAVNLGVTGGPSTDYTGAARDGQPDAGAFER